MATARRDQTRGCQKAASRQEVSAGRRIVAIAGGEPGTIDGLEPTAVNVPEDVAPQLDAVADRQSVGMPGALLRTRDYVQPPKNDLCPLRAIPPGQFECPLGECQVNGDSHHLGQRIARRCPLKQVLVPIADFPRLRSRRRDRCQRQRRRQHMLAETRLRILGIKRIDEQRVAPSHIPAVSGRTKLRCNPHRSGHPPDTHHTAPSCGPFKTQAKSGETGWRQRLCDAKQKGKKREASCG